MTALGRPAEEVGAGSGDVDQLLGRLVASVEPSVVFASLAAQCVPDLCDDCTFDIVDGADARYRIVYPPRAAAAGGLRRLADRAVAVPEQQVQIPFRSPPVAGDLEGERSGFRGTATFIWHRRTPARADRSMVALSVDHAVRTVAWQRSERAANDETAKVANLRLALQTSRQIGAAIGILMTQHKITQDQAFDVLTRASQRSHRKLRELALDVLETGWLDPALSGPTS